MHQSADVQAALLRFYDRFSAGDVAEFDRGLSREQAGMVIGTAPTEWFEGRSNWVDAYKEQIAAIPGIRLRAGDVRGWEQDSVGWAADRPTFILPDGTAIPTRLTAVLLREDGEWKLVQAHFSFGVPDDVMIDLAAQGSD